ncbi:hypothetical protein [Ciceribacter sp. T2.26MG-112.2]|uniref:hypothetical protein n=1 Tax=Ciceribacter sp. T2.26MG-112.2 TaxID=3137154 RepID=UPI0012B6967A|nr:hypothetical protein [Ciceribacter naphthalenivorans]
MMIKESLRRRLAELSPVLMATAILLGMIPQNLRLSGIQGFHIGLTFFFINLAVCALGLASRKLRPFWLSWAVASIAFFILFGMATPVGMVLILPIFISHWF